MSVYELIHHEIVTREPIETADLVRSLIRDPADSLRDVLFDGVTGRILTTDVHVAMQAKGKKIVADYREVPPPGPVEVPAPPLRDDGFEKPANANVEMENIAAVVETAKRFAHPDTPNEDAHLRFLEAIARSSLVVASKLGFLTDHVRALEERLDGIVRNSRGEIVVEPRSR